MGSNLCFKSDEDERDMRDVFIENRILHLIVVAAVLLFGSSLYYTIDCYMSANAKCSGSVLMLCIVGASILVICIVAVRWIWCLPVKKEVHTKTTTATAPRIVEYKDSEQLSPQSNPMIAIEENRPRSSSKESSSKKISKTSKKSSRDLSSSPKDTESFELKNPMDLGS